MRLQPIMFWNWTKSSFLSLDLGAKGRPSASLTMGFKINSQVHITANVAGYMTKNLTPLITLLKQKIQAWKNLTLFLIDKINLIRIKILLVFPHFLYHDPIWVPKSYFRKLDGLICLFLWFHLPPHIGLKVLQEPWEQGGLAQILSCRPNGVWLLGDDGGSATVLKAAILGLNNSLRLALYRGRKCVPLLTRSMKATWATSQQLIQPNFKNISPSAPLLVNLCLSHFYELPDPWGVGNKGNKKSGGYRT